jgi:DNA-binding MarR family transcriptional regulator
MTAEPQTTTSSDEPGRPTVLRPGDPDLGTWRTFLHAHARVTRRLDEDLQASHGLSLGEYDALLQIATSPDRRLRMNLIAERVLLSRSGVTRLIDRLVADGAVERVACSTDARGAEAVLTAAGLDRLRAASRTHLAGVARYFLDPLTPGDRTAIERGLSKVMETVGGTDADCRPGIADA